MAEIIDAVVNGAGVVALLTGLLIAVSAFYTKKVRPGSDITEKDAQIDKLIEAVAGRNETDEKILEAVDKLTTTVETGMETMASLSAEIITEGNRRRR
jgi:hypothetical protein